MQQQPPPPPSAQPAAKNEPPGSETDARMPPPRGATAAPAGYYARYYPTAAAMPQLTYMEGQLTTQAMLVEQQRRIKQLEADLYATRAEVQRLQADARARENLSGTPADNNPEKKTSSRYWTPDEHKRFLEGLELFGPRDIKAIARHVGTRSATQVRTHSQKYYIRLERERAKAEAAAAAAAAAANGAPPPSANATNNTNKTATASPISPKKSRARPRSRTTTAAVGGSGNPATSKTSHGNPNGKANDKSATVSETRSMSGAGGAHEKKETVVDSPSKIDRRKRQQPDPDIIGSTKRRSSARRVKAKNEERSEENATADGGADNVAPPPPNGVSPDRNSGEPPKADVKNEALPDGAAGGLLCPVPSVMDGLQADSMQQGLPAVPSSVALGSLPNVSSSVALGSLSNVPSTGNLLASSSSSLPIPTSLPLVSSSAQLSSMARVPSMGTLPRVSSSTGLPMVPSTGALHRVGSSGGLVLPRVPSSLTAAWNAQTAMDRAAVAKMRPKEENGAVPTSAGVPVSGAATTGRSGGGSGGGAGAGVNTGFPRTNSILSLLSGLPTNGMASVASSDRLNTMPFDTMDMDDAALEPKWVAES